MFPKVYLASKLRHVEMLKYFRAQYKDKLVITSRWLDMTHLEMDEARKQSPELYTWCWAVDVRDVAASNYLIIYGETGDELRGACVEAGVAIGLNKPVFAVGMCKSFGTWQFHPQVTRLDTMDMAAKIIYEWHNQERNL